MPDYRAVAVATTMYVLYLYISGHVFVVRACVNVSRCHHMILRTLLMMEICLHIINVKVLSILQLICIVCLVLISGINGN